MRKSTKIIATIGPASAPLIGELIGAGVDLFRINFSHGDERQHEAYFEGIRAAEQQAGRAVAICADLCGPKIRVGVIEGGSVELEAGREIVIQRHSVAGHARRISTTLPELVDVVEPGQQILLSDGRIVFEVVRTAPPEEFTCRVVTGGTLSSGKGVNLPQTRLAISALTEKDRRDIDWIARRDFDYVALSFVCRASDLDELRYLLAARNCDAHIISKIEKPQALDDIDAIIDASDAIMVARGDLGVELDYARVPVVQKSIAEKCQLKAKPCIIATEMLESMIQSSRPTRAEVSDVANAVFDNADAVMLSGESAVGRYPVEAVGAMRRIVEASERFLKTHGRPVQAALAESEPTAALAAAIRRIQEMRDIKAVAVLTASGFGARILSKGRFPAPLLALSHDPRTVRRCGLYYGVSSQLVGKPENLGEAIELCLARVKESGLAAPGDNVIVVAAHPIGVPGSTKVLVLETVR